MSVRQASTVKMVTSHAKSVPSIPQIQYQDLEHAIAMLDSTVNLGHSHVKNALKDIFQILEGRTVRLVLDMHHVSTSIQILNNHQYHYHYHQWHHHQYHHQYQ